MLGFEQSLLAYLAYDWSSSFTLGRLVAWWPAELRRRETPSLVACLRELEIAGLTETYVPREGRPLHYHGGALLSCADTDGDELARLIGDGVPPVLLAATPIGQNQVDLAMSSPTDRRNAAVFADPEYAPEALWGDASLWPNRLARDVGHRLRAAASSGGVALDLAAINDLYVSYARKAYPEDPDFLGELTYFDILAGLLWVGDDAGVSAWLRAVQAKGIFVYVASGTDWTVDTMGPPEMFDPVSA